MQTSRSTRNVPTVTGLHPAVYMLLAGCVAWIVAASWIAFASERYAALQVAVVAFFAAAFLVTPFLLYRLSGRNGHSGSFREWLDSDIEVLDGPLSAKSAMIMILCAPMASMVGITLISMIAYLTAGGVT